MGCRQWLLLFTRNHKMRSSALIEIFLQPGECYFGGKDSRIRTLLGSCVAITMWHPEQQLGGMCHYMLPFRTGTGTHLDGRYAEEAIQILHQAIRKSGTKPEDYQVKLFGGGNMFSDHSEGEINLSRNVAHRNIDAAHRLLKQYGHRILAEHVGMTGHRNIILDVQSGKVWMRHVERTTLQNMGG